VLHGLWDAAQPIAVWLTLLLTATQVQWHLLRIGQLPVTQAQVHLFTVLYWALLLLDALIGLLVLRGRWHNATTPDRPEATTPDRPDSPAAVAAVSADEEQR
jgi:protease PrsW